MPEDSLLQIELTDVEEVLMADSAWVVKNYQLDARHTLEGVPNIVKGRMELGLSKNQQGLWYISFWEDRRIEDSGVWSLFKAVF